MKDGIYWGIGHTATIFFVGILMIGFKFQIGEEVFKNFEAGVGVMLIILGLYRVFKLYFPKEHTHTHNTSRAAFGVGLIHGFGWEWSIGCFGNFSDENTFRRIDVHSYFRVRLYFWDVFSGVLVQYSLH